MYSLQRKLKCLFRNVSKKLPSSLFTVVVWDRFDGWAQQHTCPHAWDHGEVSILIPFPICLLFSSITVNVIDKVHCSSKPWFKPRLTKFFKLFFACNCLISSQGGQGTSLQIMGLATINPHSQKVHTKLYKIPKFGVNWVNFDCDTTI